MVVTLTLNNFGTVSHGGHVSLSSPWMTHVCIVCECVGGCEVYSR